MIMMVVSKNKLKKIIISVVVVILAIMGIVFMVKQSKSEATFNIFDSADTPYYQGTKVESGYVGLTCNVDLGWESEYVEGILKVLEKEDVKITFNVTGRWAEKNPELLLKIKEQGHEIGNHGHRHLDYAKLSYEENLEQIQTSKKIIEDIIKEKTKFFQAPSGSFGEGTMKAAKELGYTCIKWDVDTIDWKYREEPEVIVDRIKKKDIQDNSIVLMHPTNATTKCVGDIIQIIRDKGLRPGKLSDIF
ncbi:polysaccharide deacetylase family protein [Romboutsia sedimentorum]|uniref:polysaccharide deacetylase family protein n=1 Tax=Romboutsia sedimentorum TaxID=1368474 RepID=UPI0024DE4791|nr:polysaccharide deacetylase family protein [Romboutsia sedimentorum]MDK2585041.1 polysaccharide deacetylase family protein [Romboutsia sedimentorum]